MEASTQPDLHLEGLVHDLNNVFETILEASDLLAGDEKWQVLAATIQRTVERGKRIVGSYCETTRGSLDDIVDRAAEFAADFLAAVRRPPLEVGRKFETGLRLPGTAASWERVLGNLFINAAQAVPDGGRVEVSASRSSDGLELVVADNGPGIPEEILSKIFHPRFSTKGARSGVGLGLHIVESIVRGHGGTVVAANRAGKQGASFLIRLPAS